MSHIRNRLGAMAAALLCCTGAAASPTVLTYDVRGAISGSPLDGQDFGGYFSVEFDENALFGVQLPLLDLLFSFAGTTYDEMDFPGAVVFRGDRVSFNTLFGPACAMQTQPFAGIACDLPSTGDGWFFGANDFGGGLSFVRAGSNTQYAADATVTLRASNVPEPTSAALAVAALAGAALVRRRRSGAR